MKSRLNVFFPVFALILLLGLAFILRARMFTSGDFFFFTDQSRDLLLVKQVVEEGKVMLIGARTGFGGLFHGPLWIYSLVPAFILSGGNPFQALVPSFMIASLGMILGGVIVGWKLYGKYVGLLFGLFIAISVPLIEAIYFTTNAQVMPLLLLPYIYFAIKYLRGSDMSLPLAALFIGLSFHLEAAFAITLIPLTFILIYLRRDKNIKLYLLSALALVLPVLNYIVFDLRHNFLMTKAFFRLLKGGEGPLPGYEKYDDIVFRVHDRISYYFESFSTPSFMRAPYIKWIIFLIIMAIIVAIFKKWSKTKNIDLKDKEFVFLFMSPLIAYLFYILYRFPLWSHYTLPIVLPVSLLLALSLERLSRYKAGLIASVALVFVMMFPIVNWINIHYLKSEPFVMNSDSSYKNQLEVAEWVLEDSGNKPFSYLVFIPSLLTYGMDYLFTWKDLVGERKISTCMKSNPTYLIMYPPLKGDNNAHVFWKKNVVRTEAPPVSTKKFAGDIIVQKFEFDDNEQQIDSNYCQNLTFR